MGTTNNTSPAYSKGKGFFNKFVTPQSDVFILNDVTGITTLAMPKGAVVRRIAVNEKAGAAVTGGLKFGTAAAGAQVLAAGAVAASSVQQYPAIEIPVVPQVAWTLYIDAVTAWNGAKVDIAVEVVYMQATW